MIKFFRHIRKTLISENKMGKYFKYAIGEIILVVIGILIALSINNWNQQRINIKKEHRYILEIKENLGEDLQNTQNVLAYNKLKLEAIDSAFYYLSLMSKKPHLGKEFSELLPIITNHTLFTPTEVAFNNITSTGNIDILRSHNLRKQISQYYSDNMLDGVQNQLVISTQNFLNVLAPKMINKTMMHFITNRDFDVINVNELSVHKDPEVLSGLFVMLNKTREHNKLINQMETKINVLVESIDNYLEKPYKAK
jgi:hypothetical protein